MTGSPEEKKLGISMLSLLFESLEKAFDLKKLMEITPFSLFLEELGKYLQQLPPSYRKLLSKIDFLLLILKFWTEFEQDSSQHKASFVSSLKRPLHYLITFYQSIFHHTQDLAALAATRFSTKLKKSVRAKRRTSSVKKF